MKSENTLGMLMARLQLKSNDPLTITKALWEVANGQNRIFGFLKTCPMKRRKVKIGWTVQLKIGLVYCNIEGFRLGNSRIQNIYSVDIRNAVAMS